MDNPSKSNKNSKTLPIIIALVLVAAAFYFWQQKQAGTNVPSEQTPVQNEPTQRNSEMITEGDFEVTTSDLEYFEGAKGYLAKPSKEGNYPGVVMIHENRGINDYVRDMARKLASNGYTVLAVDLFGKSVETQEQARELTSAFNQEKGVQNLRAASKYLKDNGAAKVASLGWCFGGRQSVELAISGEPLDATVVYYGGNMASTVDKLKPIKWPVLGIFGDKDQAIPVEKVEEFKTSLNTLGVENEIYIYPGVGHAFANPSGMNYAANETKDAWDKTLNFLNKNLK